MFFESFNPNLLFVFRFLGTLRTYALIIELLFCDVSFHDLLPCKFWRLFLKEVYDLAALLAEEMDVGFGVAVITNSMVVYRNHLCCSLVA